MGPPLTTDFGRDLQGTAAGTSSSKATLWAHDVIDSSALATVEGFTMFYWWTEWEFS